MSYDLIVWPVDKALTVGEAIAEVEHLGGSFQFGLGHDKRLDRFVDAMGERYPGLHGHEDQRPFEFDVMRKHVFIGVPESAARVVVEVVAEAAWTAGVAVFDPQREVVALPPPYGDAPMGLDGIDAHLEAPDEAT
jgi:hypothetical protein